MQDQRGVFLGYNAFYLKYKCMSLSTSRLYISRDVVFSEDIYPYVEKSNSIASTINSHNEILGSLPPIVTNNQTPEPNISHDRPSNPPSPTGPNTPSSIGLPIDSPSHNIPISSPTGHIPPEVLLSPSNLDHQSTPDHVKTKSLAKIFKAINSVNLALLVKYPLPTCHTATSTLSPKPHNYLFALKQPKWVKAIQEEYLALIHNHT